MPTDRDLAQVWLAERIHICECGCPNGYDEDEMLRADAILGDVEVGELLVPMTGERRLVIKLPPAAQHQDRTEGEPR